MGRGAGRRPGDETGERAQQLDRDVWSGCGAVTVMYGCGQGSAAWSVGRRELGGRQAGSAAPSGRG